MLPLIGVPPTIAAGMAQYRDVFCRDEGFAHICRYVTGLISICLKNATNSKKAMISKNRLCQEFLKLKLENLQASLKNY